MKLLFSPLNYEWIVEDQMASLQTISSIQPFLLWTPEKVPPALKASRHT